MRTHGQRGGAVGTEFPLAGTGSAEATQQIQVGIEHRDLMQGSVGDVDRAIRPGFDVGDVADLAGRDESLILAGQVEDAHAAEPVGHVDALAGHIQSAQVSKGRILSIFRPAQPPEHGRGRFCCWRCGCCGRHWS